PLCAGCRLVCVDILDVAERYSVCRSGPSTYGRKTAELRHSLPTCSDGNGNQALRQSRRQRLVLLYSSIGSEKVIGAPRERLRVPDHPVQRALSGAPCSYGPSRP